ncbi:hypothetical protein KTT66_02755 [Lacticaseibacillus casei]|jgi:nicotinamidase-related amidase|uniref:Uncharacterized protein n=1 Tax=Lacticaseibacillus huelsenbergensis TaxID=3035291 RepID=A0ABY8DP65_9LACO|nr:MULTISPECIES: hypothetical protein [Lacticaseibacillus]MDG3061962.1 hypothetical protein [Lacticaseibacillus sp. BCRC 81376]QVI37975.1 hypothetical protein KGS74_03060 [Lacticaseibacillus casei]QXG59764.1 hypothetical protein KTT66_02755 [Lacticaseibacillus casei]WFB38769.1 hypothetical protein LHUE1_002312 [Lacticaseibacillus huelsenbergensis]WFB43164.1 hypothetical protein LHUE2_001235 [Lacticaseibacillus huelsenbergensis]
MIKENQLRQQLVRFKFHDSKGGLSLSSVQNALAANASAAQLPVAFATDELKTGGLFGSSESCLLMYHPEHPNDYFYYVFKMEKQAAFAFVTAYQAGQSAIFDKGARRENHIVDVFSGTGSSHSDFLEGLTRKGIKFLSGDKEKRKQAERDYYALVASEIIEKM